MQSNTNDKYSINSLETAKWQSEAVIRKTDKTDKTDNTMAKR